MPRRPFPENIHCGWLVETSFHTSIDIFKPLNTVALHPSVFVSYDFDNDRRYKNMLLAWDENDQFDFKIYDSSVDVSVDSSDAGPIRRVISQRIDESDVFLCMVGKHAHKSEWIDWEIEKATELDKNFAAVKIDRGNTSPDGLLGKDANWAHSFNFESVKSAIEESYLGL
jgi:hypothetical protein